MSKKKRYRVKSRGGRVVGSFDNEFEAYRYAASMEDSSRRIHHPGDRELRFTVEDSGE